MTLEELKTRCENQGFKYAYGCFKETILWQIIKYILKIYQ